MSHKHQAPLIRRQYNQWVANETLEDYALRYTAKGARRWSNARVANTALGIVSFLALEAIGGTITLNYGFINAFWAIMVVGGIIFLCGLPLSYYAARYGVDIDLLTRGAGFGYIGSTVSSLIYASFTFIFFAIEAAIMSMAISMATGIPLAIAYIISAVVVIPLVTHGITRISRFQAWTQPLWGFLQLVPLILIASQESKAFGQWLGYEGLLQPEGTGLSLYLFGACAAVIFPLIAQNGEQADFLRFLPPHEKNTKQWWFAVIGAGPGWVVMGVIKLLVGSFLAVLAINHGVALSDAADPAHMYAVAFEYLTHNPQWAVLIAAVFVVISQLKINVTNAYAGSIAWGNFFSRLTHNHPGRVVWLFFNVSIALLLMELGLYQAFEEILTTYATLVVAWIGCVVADLVINKPLGLSPKHIEFRRSHLYDINPVGVLSMILASLVGFAANLGLLGETLKYLAPFLALSLPFITMPLLAYMTRSRYYLNRTDGLDVPGVRHQCIVCENVFDQEDMGQCPSYEGAICSLCCSLDARCGDRCRPEAHAAAQMSKLLGKIFPAYINEKLHTATVHFLVMFCLTGFIIAALLSLVYFSQVSSGSDNLPLVSATLWRVFFLLLLVTGVLVWLYVLAQRSARLALNEVQSQSGLLEQEIKAHEETNRQLLEAKNAADMANQAKSRYLSGVSHELRTPLNTIYGYAQLMEVNSTLDEKNRKVASIIKRSGQHLSDVIEGLLDISKIEACKLEIHNDTVAIRKLIAQLEDMFSNQARARDIRFEIHNLDSLPSYVNTDEKRLRQILLNLLSNAFKYTQAAGSVELNISYRNQVARFSVKDTGIGIASDDQERIFDPFERVINKSNKTVGGTGLGLTISRLLAELMGGRITLSSKPGLGSEFTLQILLPSVMGIYKVPQQALRLSRQQKNKTIMVVDDEKSHCQLIEDLLCPAGFAVRQAHSAEEVLHELDLLDVDLFILDVNMPGMNGWALLSELRQNHCTQPVIMLSADPYETADVNRLKDQFSAYLNKPIEFDRLIAQIERLLDLTIQAEEKSAVQAVDEEENIANSDLTHLSTMRSFAKIGYLKGLTDCVSQLEENCYHSAWFSHLTLLVEACDFDGIIRAIDELGGVGDSTVY